MKKVIINATAARTSGALTILKDFVSYCTDSDSCKNLCFYLFTTVDDFDSYDNFKIYKLHSMNWKQRIEWDNAGLHKYCKKESLSPDLIISLQNTCSNYPNVPQLVYYHQSLPLIPYAWNPLKKEERILYLYAHFYGYFVNKYNENAQYVVQLPYIKKLFLKKFPNILETNIHVIRPNEPQINVDSFVETEHPYRFIYPATPLAYKNHKCIIEAFRLLLNQGYLDSSVQLILTVPKKSKIADFVRDCNLEENIKCMGPIPYEDLLVLYRNSDVLLFPSKIETYGMPLVEASKFGLRIIASDLPYAKEVLEDYDNKILIDPNDYIAWAEAMKMVIQQKYVREIKVPRCKKNSWQDFINIANEMIHNIQE